MKATGPNLPLPPRCWCGHQQLVDFSPDYLRCPECETLVIRNFPSADLTTVTDEQTDLYGANYPDRHLHVEFGQPDFATRSRLDLTERCTHWLRHLLPFKLPPAKLLEVGCFHGGFVGLAKLAGYHARGLDLSPELCRRAAAMFDVEILSGSLERQAIPPGSLDVIALFDVLEHLQDPRALLGRCRELLRPDGLLVIQTPCYPEGKTFAAMHEGKDPFLPLFIPEHLYLFSKRAVTRLLHETGFPAVSFEPPIFPQYDMFPFASPTALRRQGGQAVETGLLSTAGGRFASALLDMNEACTTREQENLSLNLTLQQCEQLMADAARDTREHLEMMAAQLKEKDRLVSRFDEEVRSLNQMIHSGQLTRDLQTRLHRSQTEASLAGRLLGLAAALPASYPVRWIQLPLSLTGYEPPAQVVSNLETVERGRNLVRICGWAFADEPKCVAADPPCLVLTTPEAVWLLPGMAVKRPDVAAAFPSDGPAATVRLNSGFVFEFHPSQLPSPNQLSLQVVIGQVAGRPVMTPPFPLP